MWEFPSTDGTLSADEGATWLKNLGLVVSKLKAGSRAKHIFSHVEWQMTCLEGEVSEVLDDHALVWADRSRLEEEAALASAYKVYKKHALDKLAKKGMPSE